MQFGDRHFFEDFGTSFRQYIVYQSNWYATQKGKTLQLDSNELLSFIGVNLFMGYHIVPGWKNYWSTWSDIGVPLFANTMSRNRFETVLSYLQVNETLFCHHRGLIICTKFGHLLHHSTTISYKSIT